MVFTNETHLAERMRWLRVHGQGARYRHTDIGLNARLDRLQAAVLSVKFDHFEKELRQRQRLAETYSRLLKERVPEVVTPVVKEDRTSVYAQHTIRIPGDRQDAVARVLEGRGIPTAVHYPSPVHLQPAFAHLGCGELSFPLAEEAAREVLSLPMHPFLAAAEQGAVVDALCVAL